MRIKIIDGRITEKMMQPAHVGDAGIDLRAAIAEPVSIPYGMSVKFGTGIKVAIPQYFVGLIFPKSGKGSKGLHLSNVVGVIDSPYRGEVIATVKNNATNIKPMIINPLDKIFQMVVIPHYDYVQIRFVDNLGDTERGEDGFGSTDHE